MSSSLSDAPSEAPTDGPADAPATRPIAEGTAPPTRGLAVWIATAGGVGFGPWAPGTWGAALAVLFFVLFFFRLGLPLYTLLVLVVSGVGVWASGAAEVYFGKHDDGRIVIDEVAGQLITLAPLVVLYDIPLGQLMLPAGFPGAELFSGGIDIRWLLVVTAFVAFRWFDIRKPGPVRWAEEKFPGGVGVMADDIVAGVLGAAVVMLPAYVVVVAHLRGALAS